MTTDPNAIQDRVRRFIDAQTLIPEGTPLLVGFSGGPDSSALLLLLEEYWDQTTAVHLHHGLRGQAADADLAWCEAFCRDQGVPFQSARLDVPGNREPGESDETAARRLRLAYWREHAGDNAVVALGHHQDDVLETALYRFCRGANASGLTGLRAKAVIDGVCLIRPLLHLTRIEILAYLAARGITDWRHDASNDETKYARNLLRNDVLPRLWDVGGNLYGTLRYLRDDADYLEAVAGETQITPLTTAVLAALHPALVPRVMRRWLRQEARQDLPFGETAIRRLQQALVQGEGLVDFHRDWFIRIRNGSLHLDPKNPPTLEREIRWSLAEQPELDIRELGLTLRARVATAVDLKNPDPECEYFQAHAIGKELVVRPRIPGDRFQPFGADGERKLKKLVSAAELSPAGKAALVVVCRPSGDIVWVPGVRRAELGRVTDEDLEVLELSVHKSVLAN